MIIYHQSQKIELTSEEDFNQFAADFTIIQAGGGIVENKDGQILLIYRNDFWDLPKGKLDEGELIEQCAEREIMEETGLSNIALQKPLTVTYHTYLLKGQPIIKKTSWFHFTCHTVQVLTPQMEEGITQVEWVHPENIQPYLEKTYDSIREVLSTY